MEEKMNRILKSVEDKYEKEIEKVENEVRDIKKRNKIELKIIMAKIKEKERQKHMKDLKLYEEMVKQKWQSREKELKQMELEKYKEHIKGEKSELKNQLKEIEMRYISQLEGQQRMHQKEMEDREKSMEERFNKENDLLRMEITELKKIRDMQSDQ